MPALSDPIERRQLDFVLQRVRVGTAGAAVMGSLLALACYRQAGPAAVFGWYGTAAAAFALRLWLVRGKAGQLENVPDIAAFATQITWMHGLMGAAVASAPWWFYGALAPRGQQMLLIVLAAWPAAGISVLGVHARSFGAYLICYYGMLASAWWYFHPGDWLVVAGMVALLAVLGSFSRDISRLIGTIYGLEQEKDKLLAGQAGLIGSLDHARRDAEQARIGAEQANLAKSRFLAAASHDLRQPLQAISLLSGVLRSISTGQRVNDIATQLARASTSLDVLFTSILDISRLEAGAVKPHISEFSVDALFAQLHSEYGARARAKGLAFNAALPGLRLQSDPVLFERVIRNLIENAIRYSDAGEIFLTLHEQPEWFEVTVADAGIGIGAEDQKRIFQEYYQSAKPAGAQEIGMGLGLAIVRRLCDLLEFKISVESTQGHGSVFRISIPKYLARRASAAVPAEPAPRHLDLAGRHIAVIDDDALVRDALSAALTAWGAKVSACSRLSEFEELLGHAPLPDAAIIDYRLTEGPVGMHIAQQLHQRFPNIKRVMISGELLLDPSLEASGMPVLRKPVSHDQLAAVLQELLAVA